MPLRKCAWYLSAVCLAVAVAAGAASAADNPSIEPRAERIMMAALENLHSAKSYTFRGETANDIQLPSGLRIEFMGTVQGAVRRPDRAWSSNEGEDRSKANWYDGKTFTHYDRTNNSYGVWQAPATIDELFDDIKEKLGFTPPMAPLMRGAINQEVLKGVRSGFYVGEAVVNGVPCSHVAFQAENADWQAWVDKVVPAIRRLVIVYKNLPGTPQFTVTFTEWNFNAALPDSVFVFDPPPGATKVEFEVVKQ